MGTRDPREIERHFRSLVENADDVLTVLAPSLDILLQVGAVERMLGYPTRDLEGTKFSALVDPESLGALRAACQAVADGLPVHPLGLRLRHRDGRWIDVETLVRYDSDIESIVLTTRDASERKRAERKLRSQVQQQAVVAALGTLALESGDLPGLMLEAASETLRTLEAQYAGIHQYVPTPGAFTLFAGVGLDTVRRNAATLPAESSHLEAALSSKAGLIVSDWNAESRFSDVPLFRAHGLRSGISVPIPGRPGPFGALTVQGAQPSQFNYEDVLFLQAVANILAAAIARCEGEERIRHQALHDVVTGLPNRVLFEDRLSRALASSRRRDRSVAVLFLDLDNFKRVNDSLGHATGDEVLRLAAERLSECLRAEDTLARFGGDEFVVLLPEIDSDQDWVTVSERIREMLQAPLLVGDRTIVTSVSVGVAVGGVRNPGKNAEALVRDADLAMYAAKQRGPGQHEKFADEMYEAAVARLTLSEDLRAALAHDEFEAFFQPIVCLRSERLVGMEALVRWHHPREGLLAPGAFLALAEESGVMVTLGRRVLRQACENLRRWQMARPTYRDLYVTVNLSSQEVHAHDLVDSVRVVLAETGLEPASLVLEITEGVLLHTDDEALGHLRELKELGVRLAMDDFGTGYSALSYLQHFPIDILKIDRSFIDGLGDRPDQARLVNGIVELARGVKLETIAEGIETSAQADVLRGMRAELGQGFHFARPLSTQDMDSLIASAPRLSRVA